MWIAGTKRKESAAKLMREWLEHFEVLSATAKRWRFSVWPHLASYQSVRDRNIDDHRGNMGFRPVPCRLKKMGVIKGLVRWQGRMVYYQANMDSPVFPDLRGLLFKTAGLVDVLADALNPVGTKLRTAFV
jgi:hypothetical protein